MSQTIVVGGGAAGMFAAHWAAMGGETVTLLEKNEKLGKKIFITGKGRCNFTNVCDEQELLSHVVTNSRFLYSAFGRFNSYDTLRFFEEHGMKTKVERGNRAFPKSDHAYDVIDALRRTMEQDGVAVRLHSCVKDILTQGGTVSGVRLRDGQKLACDRVIIATGGLSYPTTGSDGDGLRMAKDIGHTVTACRPSLVPLIVKEDVCGRLQGLSLRNVTLTVKDRGKKVYEEFGEMLFTHFGITGPIVLSASAYVGRALVDHSLGAMIDLKPALTEKQLDDRILREFDTGINKTFKNVIGALYPAKLTSVMIERTHIKGETKVHDITREQRRRIVELTKRLPLTITGLRGYNEAVITSGGVSVNEINPKTMESKKIPGLFFAGEVLDLDALTGGYNLQIAWSTGYVAGTKK